MRGAGDIAIKLPEAGGKGFTIMAADFGDLLQHGLLFNQRRRHDLWYRFRRGRSGDGAQLVDQFFTRGVIIQHIRQCAIGRFFCSISGSGAGSVVESVVGVVVTPGMDTAWAGAPSRQKRMNRIHRMTPPVRKQSKKISIDAGGGAILNERNLVCLPFGGKGGRDIKQVADNVRAFLPDAA